MSEQTTESGPIARRERHEQWMEYSLLGGVVGCLALLTAGVLTGRDALVVGGIGAFWTGVIARAVIQHRSPVSLYDERDYQMAQEAGYITLSVLTYVVLLGWPTILLLSLTDTYVAPEWAWGLMAGFLLVFVLLTGASWHVERKRT